MSLFQKSTFSSKCLFMYENFEMLSPVSFWGKKLFQFEHVLPRVHRNLSFPISNSKHMSLQSGTTLSPVSIG